MSSRASYVIVEGPSHSIRSERWGAQGIAHDIFWGPDYAIPFIQAREPCDALLDDDWCEGGAVVDIGRRTLLFFGSGEFLLQAPVRRAFLDLMAHPWAGWQVRWAFEGVVDFARAIGRSPESVIAAHDEKPTGDPTWACPSASLAVIVSVFDGKRTVICALHPRLCELVDLGPDAILHAAQTLARDGHDADRMVWTQGTASGPPRSTFDPIRKTYTVQDFPSAGLHLDVTTRVARYWTSWPSTIRYWATARWPGWTLEYLEDRFEDQVALSQGRILIETPPYDLALRGAVEALDIHGDRSSIGYAGPGIPISKRAQVVDDALRHLA